MGKDSKKIKLGNTSKNVRRTEATSVKTIKNDKTFPFYNEYHDTSYIMWHDCRPIISLSDPPKSVKSGTGKGNYRLENDLRHEVVVYRIDDGIVADTDKNKCDYGIYTEENKLILVELKGGAIKDAVGQIDSTITKLITEKSLECEAVHGRIVLSKVSCPDITRTYTFELTRRLKRLNGSLGYRSRQLSEKLSGL